MPGVDIRQDLGRVVNLIHVSVDRCNHALMVTFVLECQMVSRGLVGSILSWEMNSVVEVVGAKGQYWWRCLTMMALKSIEDCGVHYSTTMVSVKRVLLQYLASVHPPAVVDETLLHHVLLNYAFVSGRSIDVCSSSSLECIYIIYCDKSSFCCVDRLGS